MGIAEQLAQIKAAEATERTHRTVIENLLDDGTYSLVKIASIVGVSVDVLKKVKRELALK
jgi:hypothetical protein